MSNPHALQFHYTSCRKGLSAYAGFQTRAESTGLLLAERKELEAKALYQPPRELPSSPDADTITQQFPKAFKVFKLSTGKTVLMRAAYTGKDYSGRWGNYFVHGLILDSTSNKHWPIDAYAWSGWQNSLENDDSDPEPLPAIAMKELTATPDFSFEELKTFLGEGENRKDLLFQMLCAVFRRTSDSRSIVIREQSELDAVYWVACIQKSFPPTCQQDLTCSTYQFDPRSALAVNATVGETDFNFDEGERKYQFYVFDFVTGQHSEVLGDQTEYARIVASWMIEDPGRLARFHEFASLFDYHLVGLDLTHLLRAFRLELGGHLKLTTADLLGMLAFVEKHARPVALTRILNALGDITDSLDATNKPDDWALVINFFVACAASTAVTDHRERACLAWVKAFDYFVVQKQESEDVILTIRSEVEKKLGSHAIGLSSALLSETHLEWLWKQAATLTTRSLSIVMAEVERSCRHIRNIPSFETLAIKNLIESALNGRHGSADFQWALLPFKSQIDGLICTVRQIVDVLSQQVKDGVLKQDVFSSTCLTLGRSLFATTRNEGDEFRYQLINRLKTECCFDVVLHGEWRGSIELTTDKVKAHERYESQVLADESRFAIAMRNEMAAVLLQDLPLERQYRLARQWVEFGGCSRLSKEVVGNVLNLASKGIRLRPDDSESEKLANLISKEVTSHGLIETPTRICLRQSAKLAFSGSLSPKDARIILAQVDTETYEEFIGLVLPHLLAKVKGQSDYGKTILSVVTEDRIRSFERVYFALLFERSFEDFDASDVAAVEFWILLNEEHICWKQFGCVKRSALDAWAGYFAKMPDDDVAKIESIFLKKPAFKDPQLRKILESFFLRIKTLRPSWLGRLIGQGKNLLRLKHGK